MASIPIIDLADDSPAAAATQAAQLVDAAADHGFIYIRNHGHGATGMDVDGAFYISGKLFSLPLEEKQKCAIQNNNRGWVGERAESLDPRSQKFGDSKEAFNFGEFVNDVPQQPIPPAIDVFCRDISRFRTSCHQLCVRILYLLGLGLGLERPDFFSSAHSDGKESGSTLRFLRYPPRSCEAVPRDDGDSVRAGAHSDYGSITLLFRLPRQAGLEILRNQTWHPVPVLPPGTEADPYAPILVNIGDLLSYWTNGLFCSTVHRVVFGPFSKSDSSQESDKGYRYSIAYFCHPEDDTPLAPVPCERVVGHSNSTSNDNPYAQRKVLTAREHLMMRLAESYGDLYTEGKK